MLSHELTQIVLFGELRSQVYTVAVLTQGISPVFCKGLHHAPNDPICGQGLFWVQALSLSILRAYGGKRIMGTGVDICPQKGILMVEETRSLTTGSNWQGGTGKPGRPRTDRKHGGAGWTHSNSREDIEQYSAVGDHSPTREYWIWNGVLTGEVTMAKLTRVHHMLFDGTHPAYTWNEYRIYDRCSSRGQTWITRRHENDDTKQLDHKICTSLGEVRRWIDKGGFDQ